MNIQQITGCKSYTKGREGERIQYVIMHWGVTSKIAQIDAEVVNVNRKMSYHYAISDDIIHQYVSEANTAWHCTNFMGNKRSIGICINAGPKNPYTAKDMESAAQLIADIFRRYGNLEIKAHREFFATDCPGNLDFGWLRARVNDILNPPVTPPAPQPQPEPVVEPPQPDPVVEAPVEPTPPAEIPVVEQQPEAEDDSCNDSVTLSDHIEIVKTPGEAKKTWMQIAGEFILNADFGMGGLKESAKKLVKVFFWVSISALANFALQQLTGFRFHDIEIFGYVITATTLNFGMTAFLNGAFASFVKWVGTKTQQAKEDCGIK